MVWFLIGFAVAATFVIGFMRGVRRLDRPTPRPGDVDHRWDDWENEP